MNESGDGFTVSIQYKRVMDRQPTPGARSQHNSGVLRAIKTAMFTSRTPVRPAKRKQTA